jgi:hypothetical protein
LGTWILGQQDWDQGGDATAAVGGRPGTPLCREKPLSPAPFQRSGSRACGSPGAGHRGATQSRTRRQRTAPGLYLAGLTRDQQFSRWRTWLPCHILVQLEPFAWTMYRVRSVGAWHSTLLSRLCFPRFAPSVLPKSAPSSNCHT